tara:strand:+ start:219 stop:536 length:318 start_codon:yes stop_codon:yes gene_type:complete
MTNEPPTQQDEAIITLEGEDGSAYACQMLDVIDFEENRYVILLKLKDESAENTEEAEEDEESLVIMRLIQQDDQAIFRTIESDEEFKRVVAHVEEIARAAVSEEE